MGSFQQKAAEIGAANGEGKAAGAAILAASARKASPAAKKKNPNLLKVSGVKKPAGGGFNTDRFGG